MNVRELPSHAALELGGACIEYPGFYGYLVDAAKEGFGLSHPSDHDLSEAEWIDVATLRVRSLLGAYKRSHAATPAASPVPTTEEGP